METPWKVIIAFIGVFVAGAIFGGVFTLGAGKRFRAEPVAQQPLPQPKPQQVAQQPTPTESPKTDPTKSVPPKLPPFTLGMMRDLTKRLSPTSEQQRAFRPIVQRATEDIQR